jgi:hypothetical protein
LIFSLLLILSIQLVEKPVFFAMHIIVPNSEFFCGSDKVRQCFLCMRVLYVAGLCSRWWFDVECRVISVVVGFRYTNIYVYYYICVLMCICVLIYIEQTMTLRKYK